MIRIACSGQIGIPIVEAFGVMPHTVAVDDPTTRVFGDRQHPAVDMRGDARDQVFGALAESVGWPVLANEFDVVADSAGGDDDRISAQFERLDFDPAARYSPGKIGGLQGLPANTDNPAALDHEFVDPMTESEGGLPGFLGAHDGLGEDPHDVGAGPPGEMEARHGVAVAAGKSAAAFGPSDDRREPQPEVMQVLALLTGGELDERLRPLARPEVGHLAVEAGGPEPVLQGELEAVFDSEPTLLRTVYEEDAAQRPESLATEVIAVLLVEDDHGFPGKNQFVGGDQTR